jgi:hypothetical protein
LPAGQIGQTGLSDLRGKGGHGGPPMERFYMGAGKAGGSHPNDKGLSLGAPVGSSQ